MTPDEITEQTLNNIKKFCKSGAVKKNPYVVKEEEDIEKCQKFIHENSCCPIFKISSVTGEGIKNLSRFIYGLKSRLSENQAFGKIDDPVEFQVSEG